MNDGVAIKKPSLLHDWLHGVDSTMCKYKKRPSMLKYQSNIASNPATGMQSFALTKINITTPLKAVELGSLVHVRDE